MSSSDLPLLVPIEIDEEGIRKRVLTNTVKMLTNRKLLKKENLEKNINSVISKISENMVYKIPVDVYESENDKFYIVKIYPQKISSVGKSSGIYDFLTTFKNNPKIIIVKDVTKRALQSVAQNYKKTEFFKEKELMVNLVDHILIPKHELLTQEETDMFYEVWQSKKRHLSKIHVTDPVARYYNMKIGQICRIKRPSETSGYVNTYRLVIKGSSK